MENVVLPTLKRNDVFFDEETYYKCIDYCERRFYDLFPYQKFIYAFVFMYVDDIPLFKTLIVLMGRGNGKDGFIVPLTNFLQTHYYGIRNYNIDIVATSEEQAKDTFFVAHDMMERFKKQMRKSFYWNATQIINRNTKSRFRYNTSNAKTKDGKRTGALIFNEYHAYETDDQIKVFQSGLGKIKHPRTIIITTNGNVRGGPLDELLDVCNGVLSGESNELRYFPFICKLDDIKEVDDSSKWIKANPSIEYMPILKDEINQQYLEQTKFISKRNEFLTKRMNIPQRNEEEAMTSWDNILHTSYSDIQNKVVRETPDLNGRTAICGIDFADIQDFASAGFLFNVDGEYVWRSKTWICSNGKHFKEIKFPFDNIGQEGFTDFTIVDSNSISEYDIIHWVINEMSKYNVKKIVMDNYRFKMIRKAFAEYGLEESTKQNPNGMIEMIRNQGSIYAITAPKIERAFVEHKLNAGNSAIFRWSVNNTSLKVDGIGNKRFTKVEPKRRKNDTFMAMVAAFTYEEELEEKIIYI
ncbi:MAG: terminase TerL endonuclease subunit [Coprobacillus sp.]